MRTETLKQTTTEAALAMIRDECVPLEPICELFGCSADYAAGIADAVTGNRYFVDGTIDWCEADEHVRAEYRAGFATGEALLDEERYREGWQECYACAAAEAAQAAEPLPIAEEDIPW